MSQVIFDRVCKSFPRRKEDRSLSTKDTKNIEVLQNINFQVEEGEFLVLVGPSGCGKSTLLRLLAGLEEVTTGNIYIGSRLVNRVPPKARDIAMVFQNYALYPHLNVYDNIAFGLRRSSNSSSKNQWLNFLSSITRNLPLTYKSLQEKAIDKRVTGVANLLQIESLLNRLPKELSGGQKQRVALGRAIARNPQVFLMDEPLSNLDSKLRTETRGQIVELQRQLGITTVYVTHDRTEAMTMGDRIAVLNKGEIQQIAKPLEIYNRPGNKFVAEFIGSPSMNFFEVELIAPLTLKYESFEINLPESWHQYLKDYKSQSLLLGIRPQDFYLTNPQKSLFTITVDFIEALGNETYIKGHLNNRNNNRNLDRIIASIGSDNLVSPNESIGLSIDFNKIHLFDRTSEKSIKN